MNKKHLLPFIILIPFIITAAWANGFSLHASAGYALPQYSGSNSDTWMNASMENQYSISGAQNNPLFGLGAAYEWGFGPLALNLGASAYYLKTTVSGVNSPFINDSTLQAPTLNYSATGNIYSFMLEPKLILTTYSWQPYIFGGSGISINRFKNYSESPSVYGAGASPTNTPFGSKNTSHFAYEIGLGIQHSLSVSTYAPILALDYRYMNWGKAGLGNATSYPGSHLNFGNLYSTVINLNLIWPL